MSCIISISYLAKDILFYQIYNSNEVIIEYGLEPINICSKSPELWKIIKKIYDYTYVFSSFVINNYIFSVSFQHVVNKKWKNPTNSNSKREKFELLIGHDIDQNEDIFIPENGLYQNILITGTIGSGKTSSAMYPFTRQLMEYNHKNAKIKFGMLILDVKGNYYIQVKKYAKKYNLEDDLIVLDLNSNVKYNPLHKPNLKPQVLANRLKTILMLFSENNSESYWLDEAEKILTEAIKLCRLYNHGYVTFEEIHKIITEPNYYKGKIEILRNLFIMSKFTKSQLYDLNTSLDFFRNEFERLDIRTLSILKSEITRITSTFVSDYDVIKTFCAPREKLTITGLSELIKKGKILVLNINIADYRNLSKIIAAYLKLDFQTEIMSNLSKGDIKPTVFICDEYSEYITKTDSDFFSLSREAKCINIISTQSYSSLKKTLKDDDAVRVIVQNLINKIWYRTDDNYTIEEAQKQLGKEEKIKISKTISENAKETKYNYLMRAFKSKDSSISESYNTYTQNDYTFEFKYFTQELETFSALTFLSDGNKILKPRKLKMFPYFLNKED